MRSRLPSTLETVFGQLGCAPVCEEFAQIRPPVRRCRFKHHQPLQPAQLRLSFGSSIGFRKLLGTQPSRVNPASVNWTAIGMADPQLSRTVESERNCDKNAVNPNVEAFPGRYYSVRSVDEITCWLEVFRLFARKTMYNAVNTSSPSEDRTGMR